MLNESDINLLTVLREQEGCDIYSLQKVLHLKRGALLYKLKTLINLGIIKTSREGKKTKYFLAEPRKIQAIFDEHLNNLKGKFTQILSVPKPVIKDGERLKLGFINYFDLLPEYKSQLELYYDIFDYSSTELYLTPDEFVYRAKDLDVVVNNWACDVTEQLITRLPKLQYMHAATHMYRYVDLNALKRHNVRFSHITEDYKTAALVEYLVSQTYSLLRNVVSGANQVRSGVNEFKYFIGEQLRGKKVGILGTDIVAKELVQVLRGLGVEIAVYSENQQEKPSNFGVSAFATAEEIMGTSDILYVTWSGDETLELTKLLNVKFFTLIKKPVYILSIHKHQFIDFGILREYLYNGLIKGIVLDYAPGFPDHTPINQTELKKVLYLPNVMVTPDTAWYTQDSVKNQNEYTIRNLIAYAKGDESYLLI